MPRDPRIEARLQRWAQWVQVGDGSGYPVTSVLHPSWMPPSPGVTPTLKVAAGSDVRETHRAVGRLPIKLANAVLVHYVIKGSIAEQAVRLECEEVTVHARVERAHRALLLVFDGDGDAGAAGTFCNRERSG